jgi:hypothetical protein
MKHFRFAVTLMCAVICALLASGCAFGKMANVMVTTHLRLQDEARLKRQKLQEEAQFKNLNIPLEVFAAISKDHQIVDKTNYFGLLFIACRSTDLKDETRYIYYDHSIESINPLFDEATSEVIPVAIVINGYLEKINLAAPITFPYKLIRLEPKPLELAGPLKK